MPTAITRSVSPTLDRCELTYLERQPIDVALAAAQHRAYTDCLAGLGLEIVTLAAEAEYPDAVFVEDPAIVVEEAAVLTRMGAVSRRGEGESLAAVLGRYRRVARMQGPGTLEGGDVMRAGRVLYAGVSRRTSREGIAELGGLLAPHGYEVRAVELTGCMHLKSGCTYLGNGLVLANRAWIDAGSLEGLRVVDVAGGEPGAANVLAVGDAVMVPACYPETARAIEGLGLRVMAVDVSELMKAECGVTCMSLIV